MTGGIVDEFIAKVWIALKQAGSVFDWLLDPFWWHWLPLGILAIVLVSAAAWFFPILRSLAGAIVFSISAALYAYRKGELDERARTSKPKRR